MIKTNRSAGMRSKKAIFSVSAALALTLSACSSENEEGAGTSETTVTTAMASPTPAALTPTGPGCSQVPTTGEGSVAGMADDPVATAASNNPLLTTLVAGVKQAGLVDTLNGPGPFTVFAPVNSAFAKIPTTDMNAVMADKSKLTSVLTYHVVGERLTASDLTDGRQVPTVNGKTVTISGSGTNMKVNNANIICANVPVGNGVVHLVDTVLMPS